MNPRNRRKAKRVGAWLKVALMMLKYDKWRPGYKTYSVNYSRAMCRAEFEFVIKKNKQLLQELLK